MKLWKRNAIAAAIVLFVCGAVYLNWSYSQDTAAGKNLGEAALVGSQNDPLTQKRGEHRPAVCRRGRGPDHHHRPGQYVLLHRPPQPPAGP